MESVGLLQLHVLQTELTDPELRTLAILLYSVYIHRFPILQSVNT